jgi:hypothetical protein
MSKKFVYRQVLLLITSLFMAGLFAACGQSSPTKPSATAQPRLLPNLTPPPTPSVYNGINIPGLFVLELENLWMGGANTGFYYTASDAKYSSKKITNYSLPVYARDPAISPDGTKLLYVYYAHDKDYSSIQLYDLKTGQENPLIAQDKDDYYLRYPVWSPDAKFVYFTSQNDSNSAIFRFEIATRERKLIITGADRTRLANNGQTIFYEAQVKGERKRIKSSDLVTGQINELDALNAVLTRLSSFTNFAVAPNGKQIMFGSLLNINNYFSNTPPVLPTLKLDFWLRRAVHAYDAQVWLIDTDGKNLKLVHTYVDDRFKMVEPVWSKDSKQAAFLADGMFLVNADGTGLTNVFNTRYGDFRWDWHSDVK